MIRASLFVLVLTIASCARPAFRYDPLPYAGADCSGRQFVEIRNRTGKTLDVFWSLPTDSHAQGGAMKRTRRIGSAAPGLTRFAVGGSGTAIVDFPDVTPMTQRDGYKVVMVCQVQARG